MNPPRIVPMFGVSGRLLLVDGTNILIRAYSAFKRLDFKTSDGRPTGALYGFISTLSYFTRTYKPDYLVVTFDRGKSDFRKGLHEEYKAGRSHDEDDLPLQREYLDQFLTLWGTCVLGIPTVEADDVIGAITEMFLSQFSDGNVVIVSADHDMFQLVEDRVVQVRPTKGKTPEEVFTTETILEKYGVEPKQLPELWAMTGDYTDNIKGVPGIGPKKGLKLLQEYGTLDGIKESGVLSDYHELLDRNLSLIRLDPSETVKVIPEEFDFRLSCTEGLFCLPSEDMVEFMTSFELKSQLGKWESLKLWS